MSTGNTSDLHEIKSQAQTADIPVDYKEASLGILTIYPIYPLITIVESQRGNEIKETKKDESDKIDEDEIRKPEVSQFCLKHGLKEYLSSAIKLIKKCFPSIQEFHTEVEKDPETEEEWLTLAVTIRGEVDEVLKDYNDYISLFVSEVPWPERDKIRFSYNIV
ncbi:MAG: hypothetical protein HY883_02795 [Deltaproteobacteria bacterium]|nr:hypothetical protein [Deltaproteobacteria bacterium]